MHFHGRKSNILIFLVTISALIVFTGLFISLYEKERSMTKEIGAEQARMLNSYSEGEKALLFVDLSGQYALYDSFLELARRGGMIKSSCGSDSGFSLWTIRNSSVEKDCYPEESAMKADFYSIYARNLDSYLQIYDKAALPSAEDYDFTITSGNGTIDVSAKTEEFISILENEAGFTSFKANISSTGLALPVAALNSGTSFLITSCFGIRKGYPRHYGIDFGHPEGTPVYAIANGTVISAYNGCQEDCEIVDGALTYTCKCGKGDWHGNSIIIQHDGFKSRYSHLKYGSLLVKAGDTVTIGQQIAQVGNTGYSSGPHLHFEIQNPERTNPLCWYNISTGFIFEDGGDGSCTPVSKAVQDCSSPLPAPRPLFSSGTTEQSSLRYSVNPSFRASAEYDLSGYNDTINKTKTIVALCSGLSYSNRDECVRSQSAALSDSKISLNPDCSPEPASGKIIEELVFEKFMKYYKECEESKDEQCYCAFDQTIDDGVPNANSEYLIYTDVLSTEVKSEFCSAYSSWECSKSTHLIWLSDRFNDSDLMDYGFPSLKFYNITYRIIYSKGKFSSASVEFINLTGEYEVWPMDELLIYKDTDPIMIFVKKDAFDSPDNHFKDNACSPLPKRYYFCAKDLSHTIPDYNPISRKLNWTNPEIRFVLEIA